jgi:hypothetical protein
MVLADWKSIIKSYIKDNLNKEWKMVKEFYIQMMHNIMGYFIKIILKVQGKLYGKIIIYIQVIL